MTSPASTASAAGTWMLGDLTVNWLGFGAMRLTGSTPFDTGPPSDRDLSLRVLRRAVDLGVNHVDTAAFYFSALRSANELINSALAPYPDGLVIVTKVGPGRDASGRWIAAAQPDQLRGQVEENLRQLGRDHLDVVNLRVQSRDSLAERFGTLAELRDAGLIRHLGVSGVTLEQLNEAQTVAPVVCVQNRYSLDSWQADGDDVIRACGERGIAFVPFFAIAGGRHSAAEQRVLDEAVQAVALAHGVSPAQVRLACTLHLGRHVLAIPGTGRLDHLAENIAAGALRLSPADLSRLETSAEPGA